MTLEEIENEVNTARAALAVAPENEALQVRAREALVRWCRATGRDALADKAEAVVARYRIACENDDAVEVAAGAVLESFTDDQQTYATVVASVKRLTGLDGQALNTMVNFGIARLTVRGAITVEVPNKNNDPNKTVIRRVDMSWSAALKMLRLGFPVARRVWPKGKHVVEAGDEVRFNDFSGNGPTFADKDATDWIVVQRVKGLS